MGTNLIDAQAFGQMGANRFNQFADRFAEPKLGIRQVALLHVFANRCDDGETMLFQSACLPILIHKAFVRWRQPFAPFPQGVLALKVMGTSRPQGIMRNHTQARDTQTKLEAIVAHSLGRTVSKR